MGRPTSPRHDSGSRRGSAPLRAEKEDSRKDAETPRGQIGDELPGGWEWARLADVTFDVPNAKPETEPEREFGYVDISSIDKQTYRILDTKRFRGADAPSQARRPIRAGDVLFSNVRTYLRNIAVVPDPFDAQLCSTGFTVLRSNGAVDPGFLFRYVLTEQFIQAVTPQQTGTHYPATSDRVVLGESIPVAPLAEQRRIVAQVEALLARVQAARARLAKVPALLKRFRQSVLAAACSGELTADWREDHPGMDADSIIEDVRAIRDNKQLATFPAELVGAECLPPIPQGWKWTSFGFVIGELQNGVAIKPTVDPPGNPILRISSVRPGRVLLDDVRYLPNSDALLGRFTIRDGDLLFTRYNGSLGLLGICGMVRGVGQRLLLHPDKLMRVRFDHDKIEPGYAEIFFQCPTARDHLTGMAKSSAGQQGVSGRDIKEQPFVIPPLPEQHEIVRRVEALFALADKIEARVAAAMGRVEKITQAILARAFRGELVPTEAELARAEGRDYEPASVLLERIRAERTQAQTPVARKRRRAAEPQ